MSMHLKSSDADVEVGTKSQPSNRKVRGTDTQPLSPSKSMPHKSR